LKASEIVTAKTNNGIRSIRSHRPVEETLQRIEDTLTAKGIQIFALIDHSGEAQKIGLEMRPTKLLIFGNPKAGTPLMLAAPSIALDLPLKMLVWEDAQSQVWISYITADYLMDRHQVPSDLMQNIAVIDALAALAAA
jgi:uncharacterized protein (DUF302 family)